MLACGAMYIKPKGNTMAMASTFRSYSYLSYSRGDMSKIMENFKLRTIESLKRDNHINNDDKERQQG